MNNNVNEEAAKAAGGRHPSAGPGGDPPAETVLGELPSHLRFKVIDDPTEIEHARRLSESSYVDSLMRRVLKQWGQDFSDFEAAMRARLDLFRSRFQAFVDDDQQDSVERATAAVVLLKLGDERALDFIDRALHSDDQMTRYRTMEMLVDRLDDTQRDIVRRRATIPQTIVRLLDGEMASERRQAARAIGALNIHEAEPALWRRLEDPEKEVQARVMAALIQLNFSRETIDQFARSIKELGDWNTDTMIYYVEQAAATAEAALRKYLADRLVDPVRDRLTRKESGTWLGRAVVMIAEFGDAASLPILNEVIEAKNSSLTARYAALRGITRINNHESLDTLVTRLCDDAGLTLGAMEQLIERYARSSDPQAIARLRDAAERCSDFKLRMVQLVLFVVGDAAARDAVADNIEGLTPHLKQLAQWALSGWTDEKVVEELKNVGLLDEHGAAAAIQRLEETDRDPVDDPISAFYVAMKAGDRLFETDLEIFDDPPDHGSFVDFFAGASAGVFQPEAIHDTLRSGDEKGKTIQFIFRGRLFRFNVRKSKRVYDVKSIADAINAALAIFGVTQRFVTLDYDPRGYAHGAWAFGEPSVVQQVVDALGKPLAD